MATSGRERAQIRLDFKRLHRAADSRVPLLTKIIANALNAAYNSVTDLEAADAYSHSPESFRRAIDWRAVGTILGAPESDYTVYKATTAADVFGEVFIDGGNTASASLSGSLTMTEPLAISYGQQRAGTLIQGIQAQQLNTVRSAIGTGLSEGIEPARTGRLLRVTTGLSERQGASLVNYERGLTEKMLTGRTSTVLRGVGRPLADQRYSLANLNQQKVDNLVERYRERLVNYRAEMIARTETMRAANMGAFAEQRAQASAGLFDSKTATRIWQTTPDDRACDECTDLEGQTVGFEQSFVLSADASSNTTGENMSGEVPPLHPMCRCTFYLDVSLESLANAFRDGNFDFGAETRSLDDILGPKWQEGFRGGSSPSLPSLPRLNYLPSTTPSARAAATAEEIVAVPRARRPRKPRTQQPKVTVEIPVEIPVTIEPLPAVTIEPTVSVPNLTEARVGSAYNKAKYEGRDGALDLLKDGNRLGRQREEAGYKYYSDSKRVCLNIADEQGFTALPEVTDAAGLQAEIDRGGIEMFRGEYDRQYVDQFKAGQYHQSQGVSGHGSYWSSELAEADSYSNIYGRVEGVLPKSDSEKVMNAVLRHDARVIDYNELVAMQRQAYDDMYMQLDPYWGRGGDTVTRQMEEQWRVVQETLFKDLGNFASSHGYDAIVRPNQTMFDSAHYIVLNRSSLIVNEADAVAGGVAEVLNSAAKQVIDEVVTAASEVAAVEAETAAAAEIAAQETQAAADALEALLQQQAVEAEAAALAAEQVAAEAAAAALEAEVAAAVEAAAEAEAAALAEAQAEAKAAQRQAAAERRAEKKAAQAAEKASEEAALAAAEAEAAATESATAQATLEETRPTTTEPFKWEPKADGSQEWIGTDSQGNKWSMNPEGARGDGGGRIEYAVRRNGDRVGYTTFDEASTLTAESGIQRMGERAVEQFDMNADFAWRNKFGIQAEPIKGQRIASIQDGSRQVITLGKEARLEAQALVDDLERIIDTTAMTSRQKTGYEYTTKALGESYDHSIMLSTENGHIGGAIGLTESSQSAVTTVYTTSGGQPAVAYYGGANAPDVMFVEYLGSTFIQQQAGTDLVITAARIAAEQGRALVGAPTGDALAFWKSLGWKVVGDNTSPLPGTFTSDLWGFTLQETKAFALRPTSMEL